MIYIDIDIETEKKKKLIINTLDTDKYIVENIKENTKLNKEDIIICENDFKRLSKYETLNNIVILYNSKDSTKKLPEIKNLYKCHNKNELINTISFLDDTNKYKKQSNMYKILLILVAVISASTLLITNIVKNKSKEEEKIKEFVKEEPKKMNLKNENFVFFGDSITEIYDLNKFYKDIPVVNSGVSGDGVDDLLNEINERLYRYNPTKVFLMIGTNDLDTFDNEYILNGIKKIINEINVNRPSAKIYVESIYPVNEYDNVLSKEKNDRIMEINKGIKSICSKNSAKCTYINMYENLLDEEGNFKTEYTYDGLHPTERGYEVVTENLMPYVNEVVK